MDLRNCWIAALATLGMAAATACSPIHIPPPPPVSPEAIGKSLSRADAIADLDALMHTLEDVHPDLYAVHPRDAVAEDRRAIVAALPDSLSRVEWWVHLAPLVAGFGDGHTNIGYPSEELDRGPYAGALLFPASLQADDRGQLLVNRIFDHTSDLQRGDRILEVNGHEADALVRSWIAEFSGESNVYRTAAVAGSFGNLLLIHSIRAPYAVRVAGTDGGERSLSLTGISRQAVRAQLTAKKTVGVRPPEFAYSVLEPGIGYMNLRTMGDVDRFRTEVATMFRQVAVDRDRSLIIDIRGNGGGDSRVGDELLRYLTTKPYRGTARKDWKMSAEYRAYLRTLLRPPLRWLHPEQFVPEGRRLFSAPDGTIVSSEEKAHAPKRAEPFFSGAVYLLIGPHTFSSAVDLADAMKTYRLATLIGQETGGRPNTFGEIYVFRLPRSSLGVSVSSARFVGANGDASNHRGVIPDITVVPSPADLQAGRDAVLERARSAVPRQ